MTEPRYQKGKIYKLVSNKTDKIYIGSTCVSLAKRLHEHKKYFKQFKEGKKKFCPSSKELFEIDSDIKIILIEDYPCQSKNELGRRERFHIETNVCVNKNIPTRTGQEYREQHIEKLREKDRRYKAEHKEQISKYNTRYNAEHKQEKSEYNAQYHLQNYGKLQNKKVEYQRQYYAEHKQQINEKARHQEHREKERQNYQKNKEKIIARRRELRKLKKEKAIENNDSAISSDIEADEPILIFIE